MRNVRFIAENGLIDDVQVFPLCVLPGTPFRNHHQSLGLVFDPTPPYTIIQTPTFSDRQIVETLDEAQERFDLCLYPFPDLDLSGCLNGFLTGDGNRVCYADLRGRQVITKVLVNRPQAALHLSRWAGQLAHPYQLVFGHRVNDHSIIFEMIRAFSTANPFTPFEVVLVAPAGPPDMQKMIEACRLHRPHYLDNDLRFLYAEPGNRSMLVTLLCRQKHFGCEGAMLRQVHWWKADGLPERRDLNALAMLDGIFIPDNYAPADLDRWQTRWAPESDDFPLITFASPAAQKRWTFLTMGEDYWMELLPGNGSDGP